jgi:hypothetical protein
MESTDLHSLIAQLKRFRSLPRVVEHGNALGHADAIRSVIQLAKKLAQETEQAERERSRSAEWRGGGKGAGVRTPVAPEDIADPEQTVYDVIAHINSALRESKWTGFGTLRIRYPKHFPDAAVAKAMERYKKHWHVKHDKGGGDDPRGTCEPYDDLVFTRKETQR